MSDLPGVQRYKLAWYAVTIFLSSAVLLVLEITAGRLIAPYVGVSVYSWTSIIGVILAGLSLGNWLGGVWADRGAGEREVGITLALAGLFSLLSLLALTFVAPLIQSSGLDLISASFLYVLSMFFVPSVLLGIPTPLLTTLALALDSRAGHVVGRMHALAALGSIVGTFLTGYLLIQYFGSRNVIVASALLLFALAIPFFRGVRKTAPVLILSLAVFLSLLIVQRNGFANPCERESNYFCLRVVDASDSAPFGKASALILDHLMHGINHESEPGMLISPYVHLMDELVLNHFAVEQVGKLDYFFAGGGSYTQPRSIKAEHPDSTVTVAELDSAVTELVEQKMSVSTADMRIFHRDARTVFNQLSDERFDVVVTDAFHDVAIPYHLVTREYAQLVKSRLEVDGLYLTNVIDVFPDPKMVKSMMKTLATEFAHVDVWLDDIPQSQQRMTYVIAASDKANPRQSLLASRGFERQWFRINEPLVATGTQLDDLPVFTDDYVPVERMISRLLLTAEGL
ncbi:MAG: fused MFS/spermidine synthase [Gammaproteobacteria bacterium]|nr:fused MFS/spermidine synthase [Gammaproteobacteria bacterium]